MSIYIYIYIYIYIHTHRVSQEECARLRESVPYVKVYRSNSKHLYPKLNGYGDNGQRKVRFLAVPRSATVQPTRYVYIAHVLETGMRETGCLPSVAVQSEREVVRTINTRENILEMVQRRPRLSTCRMASRIGVSRMQVWRTLHEEDLNP